ncbi:nitroreductase family protein [Rhodoferax sp.]|uniref:nitroreductase family protein n=1 Tax=Rhodoferax sp. TaxID=50421 RepID=UPI002771289E|nr:nitroreductase family protein [Rhodoferax sp.]
MTAEDFTRLLMAHRSIRQYDERPIDPALIDQVLEDSLHGSSSSGNLNMVSVIKTQDAERKAHLCKLHFGQPMVLQAPLVLTFCADSFRTRQWLAQRGARLNFGNFISWHVASFDAIILAQTTALALESLGLGICYMGTTLHTMGEIAEYLECPDHCLPVTSMVVGWPAETPKQRDRLPGAAWIHNERYQRPSEQDIDRLFEAREVNGWNRYRNMGPDVVQRMNELGITSLAQYYTSDMKYAPQAFERDSRKLRALLEAKGFLP